MRVWWHRSFSQSSYETPITHSFGSLCTYNAFFSGKKEKKYIKRKEERKEEKEGRKGLEEREGERKDGRKMGGRMRGKGAEREGGGRM